MKKSATFLLVLAVAVATLAVVVTAKDSQTLNGEYEWRGGGSSGNLEAVFTSTGAGTWDVAFHFVFRGSSHTYSGTAKGSLTEGKLAGQVQNEDKRRTFSFSGAFKEGVFAGTHSEITDGRKATGTLTLKG